MTFTASTTKLQRLHRPRPARGCGYHRRPGRLSRWKRTPRPRGGRACVSPAPLAVRLRAVAPARWRARLVDTAAGLMLVAGLATWGLAVVLLAF